MPATGFEASGQLILAQGSILAEVTFEERVAAAATGGFTSIGLSLTEYDRLQAGGLTDAEMLCTLAVYGVRVAELEAVFGFAVSDELAGTEPIPGLRYAGDTSIDRLLRLADLFHARHLQACGTFNSDVLEANVVERFAQLCDRAAPHQLLVSLEYQRCTNIADARTAADIVSQANRPNGGVCIDTWHHFRGLDLLDDLLSVPADRIALIQFNDGTAAPQMPDYIEDTLRNRRAPGGGDFDLVGFLKSMRAKGVTAPISVEVMSDDLRFRDPFDVCSLLGDATTAVLSSGGWERVARPR